MLGDKNILIYRISKIAFLSLFCLAFITFCGTAWADMSDNVTLEPLNPDFVDYTSDNLDVEPLTISLSNLNGDNYTPVGSTYPASYDLRNLSKVTSVKDQDTLETCWTFATIGSLESCLLPGENYNFSENNMKNLLSNASALYLGFDRDPNKGGTYLMSTAYFVRWGGPINAVDDKQSTSSVSPTGLNPVKHIQYVLILPNRQNFLDNTNIKWALMKYGAIATTMYIDNYYYNSLTYSYYCNVINNLTKQNHGVDIVGWDDNYPASNFNIQAPGNGAFIVRNSYGTTYGQNGYFYVSYYDTKFAVNNFVFYGAESPNNYNKIYQYDPLGLVNYIGFGTTNWFSNVFTSTGNDVLQAVSFYVADLNSNYELSVYLNPTADNPTSGTLADKETGTLMPGYMTIPLKQSVNLINGQKFSIVVKLTSPVVQSIPVQYVQERYSSKAPGKVGQSYISNDGINWADAYTVGEIKGWKNLTVCLKAFTAASGAIDSTSPSPDGGSNGVNNAIMLDAALGNSNSDTDYLSDNSINTSAKSKVNEIPMKNSGLPLTAIVFAVFLLFMGTVRVFKY